MGAARRLLVPVVVLAVLAGLALLADVGARRLAEDRVGARIQASEALATAPQVRIGGFPFLVQAVRGHYDGVTVRTGPVSQRGGLTLSSVDAVLTGVTLPLSSLTSGRATSVPVAQVRAQGVVPYPALTATVAAQLPKQVTDLALRPTPAGGLEVSGHYAVAGIALSLRAVVRLAITAGTLVVTVPASNLGSVPPAVRSTLASWLTVRLVLPRLPYGLTVDAVAARPEGLAVSAHGSGVELTAAP